MCLRSNVAPAAPAVASGKPLNSPAVVGRDGELARIDALLDEAAAGRGGALLIEGAPGVGKTTLLEAARSRAGEVTCLSTRGIESESRLAYAGLFGLLNPIRDLVDDIPESQARRPALRTRMVGRHRHGRPVPPGRRNPHPPRGGRRTPPRAGARGRPAVAGPRVLGRHRLRGTPAGTRRRRDPPGRPCPALSRTSSRRACPSCRWSVCLRVPPRTLLPPSAAPSVVDRLVAGTEGNPLALLEVAQRLDDAQWLGAAPLPDPLPAGDRLRSLLRGDPRRTRPCRLAGGPVHGPRR